jgi:FlaG/FlaF family flagellin (archaellin)
VARRLPWFGLMSRAQGRALLATLVLVAAFGGIIGAAASTSGGALPGPLPLFPSDNWWNLDISAAPVDPSSNSYIAFIGSTRTAHPDFGGDVSPGSAQVYGFPYVVVDSTVTPRAVQFQYADESDGVDHATNRSVPFYPIPDEAITEPHWIEGGEPGNVDRRSEDRHLLIVDRDRRFLYELYNVFYDGSGWHAGSGAFFDMNTSARRPDGWTSADAAGLAILPGLVRHDEVFGAGEIRHAFRVTVRATNGYVYPASHRAGSTAGALPMGARLRLKASRNLSGFAPEVQKIFRAMQRYGLIVADNGSDLYVSGTYDVRWDNNVLNPAFRALTANDFEVITLGYQPSAAALPGPPSALRAAVNGSSVTLSWDPPAAGGPTTTYVIQAGSTLGASDLANAATGSAATTFTASNVGAGTYFVRVLAANGAGVGPPSNEVALSVLAACGGPPTPPSGLSFSVDGSTVTLAWTASAGDVTAYILHAGSTFGASDLAVYNTGNSLTSLTATNVGAGTYHVRIIGANACGASGPSNEVVITVR